jgi:serine/threonine-protein kinase
MPLTDLGACEWFVWDLRRSNLLDRGQLDQVVGEYLEKRPGAEPTDLSEYLVEKGVLTPFQAERLLQGKTQGFVLGPYTLMDALGTGSMGTVYKALNKNDNQWYAIKVLPRRSMWNVRIARRKVRAFEQCGHPTVVPFLDVGTSGGMHYLTWSLVAGETLDRKVEREGPQSPGFAAYVAQRVAEGLGVCEQQGLFHGLLKPSNIMIGLELQVYILDFGIGCLLAETEGESLVDTMSTANSVASGLDCASPESIMDPTNLTPAGDQYSLGCVLYFCLSGRFPFPDGTAAEKMTAHQFKEPVPVKELRSDVPDELAAVVERLMKKKPEDRYGSPVEVMDALRPFAAPSLTVGAVAARHVPRPASEGERPLPSMAPLPESTPALARSVADLNLRLPPGEALLPSRRSLRQGGTEPRPQGGVPEAEGPEDLSAAPPRPAAGGPGRSSDESLSSVGLVALAVLTCVLAWWVTWKWHLF